MNTNKKTVVADAEYVASLFDRAVKKSPLHGNNRVRKYQRLFDRYFAANNRFFVRHGSEYHNWV